MYHGRYNTLQMKTGYAGFKRGTKPNLGKPRSKYNPALLKGKR